MRVFVTGASGWIGSAAVRELQRAGHQVLGLARSDAAAAAVAALGAEVHRGGLDDLDALRAAATGSDGVVHLAYHHDFTQMAEAARIDGAAIDAIGEVLAGTDRPLLVASGVAGFASGHLATERDEPDPAVHPRTANAAAALALADRGVRSCVVRFAPTVHGDGDHGFVARLVEIARAKGVSAYVGEGTNRWPAVHRLDAGALVRLAVERAPARSVLHAVAEEGVPTRAIAEAIGRGLDLPVVPVPADRAVEHFDWLGRFFALDCPAANELTRTELGWEPTHAGLLDDLAQGHYFRTPRAA
ncbi:SDR family oxidoreductase [Pseudonocardia yuanmonensis]|uniref:SDR family oxidoreductase n=1 Tax=Pseudonocardia yuanmonensis TaxID=1095914 RepID=A0ABP8X091_9PSEU